LWMFRSVSRDETEIFLEKEKGPTRVGPSHGSILCARPGPDDPGGLGAEESGIERTGPTQVILIAIQRGTRWAEVGRYYDSANDPVTASTARFHRKSRAQVSVVSRLRDYGPLRRRSVSAIMSTTPEFNAC
jgi:hypothetical protein